MADIRPFSGVTYDPLNVELARVLCPPYDVIDASQQRAYMERDPHNFVRVVLNDSDGDERYRAAAAHLNAWLDSGVMRRAQTPAYYIHRQTFASPTGAGRVTRTGVVAAVRLSPWDAGDVRPHEHTMPGPKEDRLRLLRATGADTEPIWVFHPDGSGAVRSLLAGLTSRTPDLAADFTPEPPGAVADGDAGASAPIERHEVWVIADPQEVEALGRELQAVQLYIADGHHRYETALFHAEEVAGGPDHPSRFKVMLVSPMEDANLLVLPTHRMIRLPAGRSIGEMLAGLRDRGWTSHQPAHLDDLLGLLTQPAAAGRTGFGLLAERRYGYYEGPSDPSIGPPALAALDVAQLHAGVLSPLLGIGEPELARGELVTYSRDPQEVRRRVVDGEFDLGIFLRPPSVAQVQAVADAGLNMPQKSTYFWPKPLSGLVVNLHA